MEKKNLKLIYVYKVGTTSTEDNIYEFIFSKDPTNIDVEGWCWDLSPACDNAQPPTNDYVDKVVEVRTNKLNLICLHEAEDREYMHGYYNIHALAYETLDNYDEENDDEENDDSILVFHYGLTYDQVEDKFFSREIEFK